MQRKILLCLLLTILFLTSCTRPAEAGSPATGTERGGETETTGGERDESTEPVGTDEPAGNEIPESGNLLFDNKKEGIYNYCPSVLEEPDGTRYVYYCTNRDSYNVTDYIGCRKGIPDSDGTYVYGEETIVFSPSEGQWDSRHTCDPSVIKGRFSYRGTEYRYLMAYLGTEQSDNQINQVGLAVSLTPDGPFQKVGTEPVVSYEKNLATTAFQWGVGQPSLVSADCAGDVWLFYTRGDPGETCTRVCRLDCSDLDQIRIPEADTKVSVSGLRNLNGGADLLNNADFAYDPDTNRFFCASDCHPNPSGVPDYIGGAFRLTCCSFSGGKFSSVCWQNLAVVGKEQTGFPRNHNVSLVRDEYGRLPKRNYLTVCYTVSEEGDASLWSYRIYDWNRETAG